MANLVMQERFSLAGRHALICGASRGIGRATAFALAEHGAEVTLLARNEQKLQEVKASLEASGHEHCTTCVVDMEDHEALYDAVCKHLKQTGPIHILVHNTGGPPPGAILEATSDDFRLAFQRHVLSAHLLTSCLLPGMGQAGYGRIVNVLSTSVREPIANLGVSNVTRAAMAAWAKTIANELPPGITINNILPGYTDTERLASLVDRIAKSSGRRPNEVREEWQKTIPEGRIGKPEEIAAAIAFLVSPGASYVRGVSLAVDGGRLHGI